MEEGGSGALGSSFHAVFSKVKKCKEKRGGRLLSSQDQFPYWLILIRNDKENGGSLLQSSRGQFEGTAVAAVAHPQRWLHEFAKETSWTSESTMKNIKMWAHGGFPSIYIYIYIESWTWRIRICGQKDKVPLIKPSFLETTNFKQTWTSFR